MPDLGLRRTVRAAPRVGLPRLAYCAAVHPKVIRILPFVLLCQLRFPHCHTL